MTKKRIFYNGNMTKQIKSGASAEVLSRKVEIETFWEHDAIRMLKKAHKGWNFELDSKEQPILERVEVEEEIKL